MEKENKEDCENCGSFESKRYSPQMVMRKFHILAVTKSNNGETPEEGGFTSLLKCPRCNSYYLVDLQDSEYPDQNNVIVKKYQPKIEEAELIKTMNRLEGILSPIEIDGASITRSILNEDKNQIRH